MNRKVNEEPGARPQDDKLGSGGAAGRERDASILLYPRRCFRAGELTAPAVRETGSTAVLLAGLAGPGAFRLLLRRSGRSYVVGGTGLEPVTFWV
jgi:hypothetical protein